MEQIHPSVRAEMKKSLIAEEKVYRMDGVPEWMSRMAESREISIAAHAGRIFATDGHVMVLAFEAPECRTSKA